MQCLLGIILLSCFCVVSPTVTTLMGGEITLNGAVTAVQIDIFVNFTANVQWLALIWSQDQTDADVSLFQIDASNTAHPVSVSDMYLDQNSYIQNDFIDNIQPSITSFSGSISNGLSVAYSRNLNTGDANDITLYPNSVIQVCFISSLNAFVGKGYQTGNEKVCSYLSIHQAPSYFQNRLLGNFAGTTIFGGGNLTFYATESTDQGTDQLWLFMSVIHKGQGLSPYSGKWIGITYLNSLSNLDMALITYQRQKGILDVHINDCYIVNSTFAANDTDFVIGQGSQDLSNVLGGYDPSGYLVASFKRKLSTGDVNRDSVLVAKSNTFCFICGDQIGFGAFVQPEIECLSFSLQPEYDSNFRVAASTTNSSSNVIQYKKPQSIVVVKKLSGEILSLCMLAACLIVG